MKYESTISVTVIRLYLKKLEVDSFEMRTRADVLRKVTKVKLIAYLWAQGIAYFTCPLLILIVALEALEILGWVGNFVYATIRWQKE